MAGSGKSVTGSGKASGAQAQIVLEARAILKKERDDDCGVGESWGEICAPRSKRRPLGGHHLADEAS